MAQDLAITQLALDLSPTRDDLLVAVDNATGTNKAVPGANLLALTLDSDLTFSDVTNGDVSAAKHGFSPKGTKITVQEVSLTTGAVASGTALIPADDSKPQITEGDLYLTKAITPKNAANILTVVVTLVVSSSVANNTIIAALFQDAGVDALAATWQTQPIATGLMILTMTYIGVAGTTSATTFTVRAGGVLASTTTLNGQGGARKLGGVSASSIVITETLP